MATARLMKIVFTICSNNYLAQARVLGESVQRTNPNWNFFIGLVDRRQAGIDYNDITCQKVIDIESAQIPGFERMTKEYNVIELSTAVKAALFQYFFTTFPEAEHIMYLDPDIMVFNSFATVLEEVGSADIALTPHVLSPIPLDGFQPQENQFLNHGIFNLGFLLLRRGKESYAMLEWWEKRMRENCIIKLLEGYFVDQLWMNLVPIYYRSVVVLRNPGLNVAYWNFHERRLSAESGSSGKILVNGLPLVFLHFSSYSPRQPDKFCWRGLTRFTFQDRPDLKPLFQLYHQNLLKCGFNSMKDLTPYFEGQRLLLINQKRSTFRSRIINGIRLAVPEKVRRKIRNFLRD
jgi:hypothetical protein